MGDHDRFPLVLSQDGSNFETEQLIRNNYANKGLVYHIRHAHESNAMAIAQSYNKKKPSLALGYVRIAQHYGFAMRCVFEDFGFQQAVFLEEDMEIAPDF